MNTYKKNSVLSVLFVVLFVCGCIIPRAFAESQTKARTFHSKKMCSDKYQVSDCSFQISPVHTNSCHIYNTEVCVNNEFLPWKLEPLLKPTNQFNSEFTVTILPYAVYVHKIHEDHPVSAINISLTSFSKNISGYSIVLTEADHGKNICRIIDFRNSLVNLDKPFTFFYDCFKKLVEDLLQNVTMTFRAYPLNIELNYFVYIPPKASENSISPCDWKPLVMIFHGSLLEKHVQLKFSNSPSDLNISQFVVTLLDHSAEKIKQAEISYDVNNKMIASEFLSVKGGHYSISIGIILDKNACTVFRSGNFLVGHEVKDYTHEFLIFFSITVVISAAILLYLGIRKCLRPGAPLSKPTVLLVYFHKRRQHEFLIKYAEYLQKRCGIKVYTLYGRSGNPINPKEWLEEVYSKSDIIVFVISKGLFQVFEQKTPSDEIDHYWIDQLSETKALIDDSKIGEKKFCKICFPYSGKQHVPKCLERKGPLFMLPDDNDKFICFLFNCSSKLRILYKLFRIKHNTILNSNCTQEDEKNLKEELKNVIKNESDDVPVFWVENVNSNNSQNVWKKQSCLKSEDDEILNKKVINIMERKCNIPYVQSSENVDKKLLHNECEKQSNTSAEINGTPSIPLNECNNENTKFLKKAEDSSHMKNDVLKLFTSKMLNFEV